MYCCYARYYSTNTKHFYKGKNHITYRKQVKSLIYIIIFNFIWRILHNLFVIKQEKVKINFIHFNIDYAPHINGYCQKSMRRKTNYSIVSKDFFDPSLESIN